MSIRKSLEKILRRVSNKIYCDEALFSMGIPDAFFPSQYHDYPFLVLKNVLSKQVCNEILESAKHTQDLVTAKVKSKVLDSVVAPTVKENIRKTVIAKLSKTHRDLYIESFLAQQKQIENFFNVALTLSTKPQVLKYEKGFFYIKHSDDSNEIIDSSGKTVGFNMVAPLRKMTTVLFASSYKEDFLGGELVFNYLKDKKGDTVTLKPSAGDMVAFPSNPFFSHEVKKVQSGVRISLVQWHNGVIN